MYFDPGIGSLIIQAIIGILAVGGGYLAVTKTKIKNFFSRKRQETSNSEEQNNNSKQDEEL